MFVRSSLMNACIYYGPQVIEVQEELQPCYDQYTVHTDHNELQYRQAACSCTSCECDCGEYLQPIRRSQTLESTTPYTSGLFVQVCVTEACSTCSTTAAVTMQ